MIVKQYYAGWIGVKIDGHCVNATTMFKVTSEAMSRQLVEYKPTEKELKMLLDNMHDCDPAPMRTRAIQYLKNLHHSV